MILASAAAAVAALLVAMSPVSVPLQARLPTPEAACWKCHQQGLAPQLARTHVHRPFTGGAACTGCHRPHGEGTDGKPGKAGLVQEQVALCTSCHDGPQFRRANVHSIITGDGCTACHAPHAGDRPFLLVEAPEALCVTCHDGLQKQHGGIAVDGPRCLGCHDPHSSKQPKLLRAVVHEPLSDCGNCHAPKPGKPFALEAKPPKLCEQCHDGPAKDLKRKSVHPPMKDGECTSCHSPHASPRKALLLDDRPRLCFGCHEDKPFTTARHAPVRDGRCAECHAAHASDQKPLLVRGPDGGPICIRCHTVAATWATQRSAHEPARSGDCTACHASHSNASKLLLKPGGALCAECHEVQDGEKKKKNGGHPPVAAGECLSCHVPHGSAYEHLLAVRQDDICLRCHQPMYEKRAGAHLHNPFEAGRCSACHAAHGQGYKLVKGADPCARCHAAAEARWAAAASRHPPVEAKECTSCHDPHGGEAKLLRKAGSELCFECHDEIQKKVEAAGGDAHPPAATGECLACHDPHGGPGPKLLAAPFVKVCGACHGVDDRKWGVRHARIIDRVACSTCHDPHGKPAPKRDLATCDRCHDRKRASWKSIHAANVARDVACAECHKKHSAVRQ